MPPRIKYEYLQEIGNNGVKYICDIEASEKHRSAKLLCSCGSQFVARIDAIKSGAQMGCGCFHIPMTLKAVVKHGDYKSPLYKCFMAMRKRCNNKADPNYRHYGGRGISVCDDWDNYEAFKEWATLGGYKKGLVLDRVDNNRGYSPENCRWVTQKENMQNTRKSCIWSTPEGDFNSLKDACDHYGKDIHTRFRSSNPLFIKRKKYEHY